MQEQSIFIAALDKETPAERAAFLDEACRGDTQLRRRIDRLLERHERSGSFLELSPGSVATVDQSISERAGTVIGPYKLLEQIGEGGFGVVYLAEQTQPVRRKVALKVLKPGMDTRQVVTRFEAERQALAIMDHPNIAKVHDGGATPSGRPYFVMELVKGVPITEFCDHNHLPPRQRLELFIPVCQAVQHAHQKGVIHRDLKPSNILVVMHDTTPVVKVIDFGVAKALGQELTDKTLFTGFAQMIGTPLYMSPEQAGQSGLDIDTRSDIYSLGVLLYELLTGTTPLDRARLKEASYDEIRRIIREEEPPKPSTRISTLGQAATTISTNRECDPRRLSRLLRGELDWIVMKCLEKDRNRRYETATGLAMDLQRYLADEPVQAGPPSLRYRLRKFVRRNRTAVAVAVLAAFLLLLSGSAIGWTLGDRARKLTLTEEAISQALGRSTRQRDELHAILGRPGGVQELLNQQARWKYMIQSAQSELEQARRQAARADGTIDAELAERMDELEQRLSGDDADRLLALRLEGIRLDRANWAEVSFDNRRVAEEYPKALAGFGVLSDDPAVVATRMRSSPIKEQLISALDDWAWVEFVLRKHGLADRLLAIARACGPDPEWGDRLRQLSVWRDQAALSKLVEKAPADRLSPQLLMLIGMLLRNDNPSKEVWLRRAQAKHPSDFWLSFNLAETLGPANPGESASFFRVALAIRPDNSAAHMSLGLQLHELRKMPEALAAHQAALAIDPRNAKAWYNLGIVFHDQKNLPEAVGAYRRAIGINARYAFAYNNLGLALYQQGHRSEAIAAYHKAIECNPNLAKAYYNLGLALSELGRLPEAIAAYQRAIALEPGHPDAHFNLGIALSRQGKLDDAIACYKKAIEVDPAHVPAFYNLGRAFQVRNHLPEAIAAYQRARELDPSHAETHCNLGIALMAQGKVDDAIACYRKAIEIEPKLAQAYNSLGLALDRQKKHEEAIAAYQKAIELNPKSVGAHRNLGTALRERNQLPEAAAAFRKAIELDPKLARAHYELGTVLHAQQKLPEAIASFQKAIELDPKHAASHYDLGLALRHHQQVPEAIAAYRRAIELKPDYPEAHCNLGRALELEGQFTEALAAFRRGHELGSKKPGWRYPSAQWVRQCERWLELDKRLPFVLHDAAPLPRQENLEFGYLCALKRWHGAAAGFFEKAYAQANSPTHLAGIKAAALAGCGHGEDAAKLDDKERARWRARALDWFKADLLVWRKQLASEDAKERSQAQQQLASCLRDSDLAGVRDGLDRLPLEEREAWRALWADVDKALQVTKEAR